MSIHFTPQQHRWHVDAENQYQSQQMSIVSVPEFAKREHQAHRVTQPLSPKPDAARWTDPQHQLLC